MPAAMLVRRSAAALAAALVTLAAITTAAAQGGDVFHATLGETSVAPMGVSAPPASGSIASCTYEAAKATGPSAKDCKSSIEEGVAPMVIDCKHVWNYISEYLDGALPDETRDTVQKHLDHCEICSAILDSTRNVIILTADDRVFELPVGFSERLHARIDLEFMAP